MCFSFNTDAATWKSKYQALDKQLRNLSVKLETFDATNKTLNSTIASQQVTINQLNEKIDSLTKIPFWEGFYNNKYPKTDLLYHGRPIPRVGSNAKIDVRTFFNEHDSMVSSISNAITNENMKDDEKALACLRWVKNNITYYSDTSSVGYSEYWQFPFETITLKKGDCEDGAILLANLLLASGIPYWKIRLTAGEVDDGAGNAGGHCFCQFFYQDEHENECKWVLLDWCYWYNDSLIKDRKDYKDEEYYKDSWFSWNSRFAFAKDTRMTEMIDKM